MFIHISLYIDKFIIFSLQISFLYNFIQISTIENLFKDIQGTSLHQNQQRQQLKSYNNHPMNDYSSDDDIFDEAHVLPTDNRKIVQNSLQHPYTCIGKLQSYFQKFSNKQISTATIIDKNLIITTAHSVTNCQRNPYSVTYAKRVVFFPHVINNKLNTDNRGIEIFKFHIDKRYQIQQQRNKYDYAILQLSQGKNLIHEKQAIQPNFQVDLQERFKNKQEVKVQIIGYPQLKKYNYHTQLFSQVRNLFKFDKDHLIYQHTTDSGHSGTGILLIDQNKHSLIGVHKGSRQLKLVNIGINLNLVKQLKNLLQTKKKFKEIYIQSNQGQQIFKKQIKSLQNQIETLNKELLKSQKLKSENEILQKQVLSLNQKHGSAIKMLNYQNTLQIQKLKQQLKQSTSKNRILNFEQKFQKQINEITKKNEQKFGHLMKKKEQQIYQIKKQHEKQIQNYMNKIADIERKQISNKQAQNIQLRRIKQIQQVKHLIASNNKKHADQKQEFYCNKIKQAEENKLKQDKIQQLEKRIRQYEGKIFSIGQSNSSLKLIDEYKTKIQKLQIQLGMFKSNQKRNLDSIELLNRQVSELKNTQKTNKLLLDTLQSQSEEVGRLSSYIQSLHLQKENLTTESTKDQIFKSEQKSRQQLNEVMIKHSKQISQLKYKYQQQINLIKKQLSSQTAILKNLQSDNDKQKDKDTIINQLELQIKTLKLTYQSNQKLIHDLLLQASEAEIYKISASELQKYKLQASELQKYKQQNQRLMQNNKHISMQNQRMVVEINNLRNYQNRNQNQNYGKSSQKNFNSTNNQRQYEGNQYVYENRGYQPNSYNNTIQVCQAMIPNVINLFNGLNLNPGSKVGVIQKNDTYSNDQPPFECPQCYEQIIYLQPIPSNNKCHDCGCKISKGTNVYRCNQCDFNFCRNCEIRYFHEYLQMQQCRSQACNKCLDTKKYQKN